MEDNKLEKIEYKNTFNDELSFSFYSILKNEDADPAIVKYKQGENDYTLITVADGLGGSGAEKVSISESDLINYKNEILRINDDFIKLNESNCFKTEFQDVSNELSYFNKLVSDILPNESYTNALLASRIVIFRYIYYMINNNLDLSNQLDKQKIIDFVKSGIINVKEKLNITKKIELFSILPTTLVSIRYNETNNTIDVIWAGDSRAYILTKNGLFQLSNDDEDLSGKMTNNFSYDRVNITLNVKTYKISDFTDDNKFVLLCSSDGFFDIFGENDYLYDEYMLLHFINKNENIIDAAKEMKQTFTEKYLGDDITVSYDAFGFNSYEDLKSYFSDRYNFINNLLLNYETHGKYIKYININETTAKSYIVKRLKDFRNKFMTFISDNPETFRNIFGIDDILNTRNNPYKDKLLNDESIRNISCIDNYLKDKKALYDESISNTYPDFYAATKEKIEWFEGLNGELKIVEKAVSDLEDSIKHMWYFFKDNKIGLELSKIMDINDDNDAIDYYLNDLLLHKDEFIERTKKYINSNNKNVYDLCIDYIDDLEKLKGNIESKPNPKHDIKNFAEIKAILVKIIDVFSLLQDSIKKNLLEEYNLEKDKLINIEENYKEALNKLIIDNANNLDTIFDLEKLGTIKPVEDRILELLKNTDEKTFINTLVEYIKDYNGLDQLFSKEALNDFRLYYEYGTKVTKEDINSLIKDLESLKENYSSYL